MVGDVLVKMELGNGREEGRRGGEAERRGKFRKPPSESG
jgi:hypothetical protein